MSIAHDNTPRRGGARPLGGRDDGLRHDGPIHDGSDPDNAAHDPSGQTGSPQDDMLTVPIPARPVVTTFDAASRHERIEVQPVLVRRMRRAVTGTFGLWVRLSTAVARKLDWFPRVDPYVGYGTEVYSRLICRTVYAPKHSSAGTLTRGIKGMLAIPASRVQVRISIDGTPLETVQIGESERYDEFNPMRDLGSEYAVSDESGYLDLVAEHQLETGVHRVTYRVKGRPEVSASLFTIPSSAKVGIISDVDDTVMVTQAPILWKAAYNLLFLNPKKRNSVPGMSVLFTKLQDMFPDAPFFYLSTSPGTWKDRSGISSRITASPKGRCCCATSTRARRRSCRPVRSTSWSSPNSSWRTSPTCGSS